jgi:hypothetical protein
MVKLEDLKPGVKVKGILPQQDVSVVGIKWHGTTAVELIYKRPDGQPGSQLLFRNDETNLETVGTKRAWSFSADGDLLRLVAEAYRIHLAHLFDPVLAVHTSLIEPLPHQITGVYGDMLPLQPLRFLLADNPGAGRLPPVWRRPTRPSIFGCARPIAGCWSRSSLNLWVPSSSRPAASAATTTSTTARPAGCATTAC